MQRGYRQQQPREDPPGHQPRGRRIRLLVICVGLAAMLLGVWRLIRYGMDLRSVQHTEQSLRKVYYQDSTLPAEDEIALSDDSETNSAKAEATVSPPSHLSAVNMEESSVAVPAEQTSPEQSTASIDSSSTSAVPTTLNSFSGIAPGTATNMPSPISPSATPLPLLLDGTYPHNPHLNVSSRFKALQRESQYIVGWLNIENLIDDAVVQRNNTFFLTHDAKGKENVNGALFLDEGISLRSRPYTYLIYGHNMKSGAMFGSLRNYENTTFYHNTPLITFDTIYEEGTFVVFSVGSISTSRWRSNYLNFNALRSIEVSARESAIQVLRDASIYHVTIDVNARDQLLLLITCVEENEDRRMIAARRIRDDESPEDLIRMAGMSWKK